MNDDAEGLHETRTLRDRHLLSEESRIDGTLEHGEIEEHEEQQGNDIVGDGGEEERRCVIRAEHIEEPYGCHRGRDAGDGSADLIHAGELCLLRRRARHLGGERALRNRCERIDKGRQ